MSERQRAESAWTLSWNSKNVIISTHISSGITKQGHRKKGSPDLRWLRGSHTGDAATMGRHTGCTGQIVRVKTELGWKRTAPIRGDRGQPWPCCRLHSSVNRPWLEDGSPKWITVMTASFDMFHVIVICI